MTVQVLNDSGVQNGDVTLAFSCIDPPITASAEVDGASATFYYSDGKLYNRVTDADADGHWHYTTSNGADAVMVSTTEEPFTGSSITWR